MNFILNSISKKNISKLTHLSKFSTFSLSNKFNFSNNFQSNTRSKNKKILKLEQFSKNNVIVMNSTIHTSKANNVRIESFI
jgi:hypothetical protein